jgi:hypothetical protein
MYIVSNDILYAATDLLLLFGSGLPAGSPEPRSSISANIWAMKKFGTALEWARRAAFKSVLGQR